MPILNWITKDKDLQTAAKTEYRLLNEISELGYGDKSTENMLIEGDNLEALKALLPFYAGQVKCIYIDPPYNTGAAFEHYDDNLEHSQWLAMMYPRLELLRELLAEDGSIYVQIDNAEQPYLKVIMDEIFHRRNFVQMVSVKRASPAGFKVINPGPLTVTEYILLYAKNKEKLSYYPQRIPVKYDKNYDLYIKNLNASPELWELCKLTDLLYERWGISTWQEAKQKYGENWKIIREAALGDLALELKDSVVSVRDPHKPSEQIKRVLNMSQEQRNKVFIIPRENYSPIYIYNGGSLSFYKEKLREIEGVLTPTELLTDFWADINYAGIAQEGKTQFKNSKKPEMLVRRVIDLATKEGDLILDSFLGSGTTAAVAQKMGRCYIGIEMGEHAKTHCAERLKKVIEGEQGGISKSLKWNGGGGFRYYILGETVFDSEGKINPNIKFPNLAAHIWFSETKTPWNNPAKKTASTVLGIHNGVAYALLYNGILGDRTVNGGNVLTSKTLEIIKQDLQGQDYESIVIYGEYSRLGTERLKSENIEFKQTPYDIKKR